MLPGIARFAAPLALAIFVAIGCSGGDYVLERRGGPFPTAPVVDAPPAGEGAAGAGEPGGAGGAAALIPFCDALGVIRNKCQRCHGDPITNAAPVPFLTYEDLQAQYYDTDQQWWQVAIDKVERDVMPFVALNDSPSLVGGTVQPLGADEKATLLGWLKQGALPVGGTACPAIAE